MAKSAEYHLGEFTFSRGWCVVAESSAIGKKPHNARYFAQLSLRQSMAACAVWGLTNLAQPIGHANFSRP